MGSEAAQQRGVVRQRQIQYVRTKSCVSRLYKSGENRGARGDVEIGIFWMDGDEEGKRDRASGRMKHTKPFG